MLVGLKSTPYLMQASGDFLDDPTNLVCFDCTATPSIRVVDLKFGVVVCQQCAARHPDQSTLHTIGDGW
jgi:ribosomal protein L40E